MKESKASPWKFFVLALSISWFFWIWVILLGWNVFTFPAVILGALGLFGPAIAEIILIARTHGKEEWRDYWQRVFDIRRIGKRWHLVIWLTFPVLNTLALLLSVLTGSPWPEFETARDLLSEPWRILPFAVFILLYGPLPEELGWRGYALDGLFMCNFSGNLIPLTKQGRLYSLILIIILSIIVTLILGPKTLTRNGRGCQRRLADKGILRRFFRQGDVPVTLALRLHGAFHMDA